MIQRIQSIWLLISAISSGFMMNGAIINFISKNGPKYVIGFSGICRINDTGKEVIGGFVPLAALIIIILLISIISIFLFKSRYIQKAGAIILIAFSICLIIMLAYSSIILMKNNNAELVPGIKMFLPLIILLSGIFAFRGISRDENLIKSYDRLR
jgi:Domain of unknown function (DUF4293)